MRRRIAILSADVGLGLSFGWSTVAFGQYPPVGVGITVTDGCSVSGGSFTVSGTHFVPGESITLTLHSTPVSSITTHANSTGPGAGDFGPTTVTVPSTATPDNNTPIVATGDSGDSATITVDVASSTCAASSGLAFTGAAGSGLAFTGADIAALSSVGAIALALGGMLILTGRRRRRSTGV